MGDASTFHWADYVIFAGTLFVSAAIGIYYRFTGEKQSTTFEFLLGSKQLKSIPVALSLQASFLSAVSILGIPAEIYQHGIMYIAIVFGYLVAFPVAAHCFVPIFHKQKLLSAHELLETRFNRWVSFQATIIFSTMTVITEFRQMVTSQCGNSDCGEMLDSAQFGVFQLIYMAIVLYAPALAFSQVSGMSMWVSMVGVGLVCTFYTTLGGLKAVVVTDTFQMLVIYAGIIALVVGGSRAVGGGADVVQVARESHRLDFNNVSSDPRERHTFWSLGLGGIAIVLAVYGSNQSMIQRYLSIKKLKDAQMSVYFSLVSTCVSVLLLALVGLVMFAFYSDCDPLATGRVQRADQLIPLFVLDVLGSYPGLPGLFTACVFSASLSTVSSGVNSLAAVWLSDMIVPLGRKLTGKEMKETTRTTLSKWLAVLFGLSAIGLGFLTEFMGKLLLQITNSVFGLVGGPLLGMFCLAMFCPRANSWGVFIGTLVSVFLAFWLKINAIVQKVSTPALPHPGTCQLLNSSNMITNTSSTNPDPTHSLSYEVYRISYLWYSVLTVTTGVVVGLLISLITDRKCGNHNSDTEEFTVTENETEITLSRL